jgi:energy-coupling factor transport system substrate-specific component
MDNIRKEFTTSTLVLIPIAIAINVGVNLLVQRLGLPLYLDSIGTVLVGVLVGPWSAALTGILAVIVITIFFWPPAVAWAAVAAVIGILAAVFNAAGWMKTWWKAALAGLITGIIAAILSAPIAAYVYGGVTGQAGTDALVAFFRGYGLEVLGANLAQGAVSDPLDKLISFVIVWAIMIGLPERFKTRFTQ